MRIAYSLKDIPIVKRPCALSIGMFDGVHKGHLFLIRKLWKRVAPNGSVALLTYANHPLDVLNPTKTPELICSLQHKLELFNRAGVDLAIVLPFTKELSQQTFYHFLNSIHKKLPFSFLILGENAAFGRNRQGSPEKVKDFGVKHRFEVEYIQKKELVSSSLIREAIKAGNFAEAEKLLGRPIKEKK